MPVRYGNAISNQNQVLAFQRVSLLICPSGSYCREDRCQSFFSFELIPSQRAPMEECEAAAGVSIAGAFHQIIDAPAVGLSAEQFLNEVLKFKPDLIVLAVTFGSLEQDLEWAKELRVLLPNASIGLRGAPAYVWSRMILREHAAVDFTVQGDYELIFTEIVRFGLHSARGVSYRASSGQILEAERAEAQNLDELPHPDRQAIDPALYRVRGLGSMQATIHVQRGCPFPCSYCLVHTVSGNRARHRSPDSIAKEVREVMDAGIHFVYLRAETFTLNRKWALSVAEALSEHCRGVKWISTTRIELIDAELLAVLKKSGCYGLSFGIDVASEAVSQLTRKPVLGEETIRGLRLCDSLGILSLGYFMIGFPNETEETLAETGKFITVVRPDLITIHYAHPYPGTELYRQVKEMRMPFSSLRAQSYPAYTPPALTPDRLEQFARRSLRKHYTRPAVLWSISRKIGPLFLKSKFTPLLRT